MVTTLFRNVLTSDAPTAQVRLYRGPRRGDLDEAAIVPGWLPSGDPVNWVEITAQLVGDQPLTLDHDGTGYAIAVALADEGQAQLPPRTALAVIARFAADWQPPQSAWSWSAWMVVGWGYLTGEDQQGGDAGQTGQRTATYHGWWDATRLPAHRLGQRNLAPDGQITYHSPPLGNPAAEAPLEYVSQDNCDPEKILDSNVDTVYVADVFADPFRPAIGSTDVPRMLRVSGPQARGVAVGGQPRYLELWCGFTITAWGDFQNPAAVPNLFEQNTNAPNNSLLRVAIEPHQTDPVTGEDYGRYRVRCFYNPSSPFNTAYAQWNIGSSYTNRPVRITFEYQAGDATSVGGFLAFSYKNLDPSAGTTLVPLTVTPAWQEYSVTVDSSTAYGGVMVRFGNGRGMVATHDFVFQIRKLRVSLGYSDQYYGNEHSYNRLFLSLDDGAGHQKTLRIASDLAKADDWRIGADDTILIADDADALKTAFDPGDRLVLQMKNVYSDWYFAPGVGRMALRYGTSILNPNAYDQPALTTIEELVFAVANGGVPWRADQALTRQNPLGGGFFATEDYPRPGLSIGDYGAAFVCVDLGAYVPPNLDQPLSASTTTPDGLYITLTDPDEVSLAGFGTVGAERIWWNGKDAEGRLIIAQRGFAGTGVAAHNSGDAFWPDAIRDGDLFNAAGFRQIGWPVHILELHRGVGTPGIVSGALIYSNLVSPRDPSDPSNADGGKWEMHPDWDRWVRWAERYVSPEFIENAMPRQVVECRHVGVVFDKMARYANKPQRAKLNELVAWKWQNGSGSAGNYQGHALPDLGAVCAHLLTQHGGIPLAKVSVDVASAQVTDLQIAASALSTAIQDVAQRGQLAIWCDPYNTVHIDAARENPAIGAWGSAGVFGGADLHADPSLSWERADQVAQVVIRATTPDGLVPLYGRYPSVPNVTGEIVQVSGVLVASGGQLGQVARATYRARNGRRRLRVSSNAAPWLRPNLRVTVDLPAIDADGAGSGIDYYVVRHTHRIELAASGPRWETDWELEEATD